MALARPRGVPVAGNVLRADRSRPGRSASATICRSDRAAASRFATTSRSMASTCSSCGRRRAARPAGSWALPTSRISSMSAWTTPRSGRHDGRTGIRAGRGGDAGGDADEPREERDKKILELLTVPRAGEGRLASGSGLLRREDRRRSSKTLFDPSLRRDPYRAGNGEPRISSVTITGPQPDDGHSADTPTNDSPSRPPARSAAGDGSGRGALRDGRSSRRSRGARTGAR